MSRHIKILFELEDAAQLNFEPKTNYLRRKSIYIALKERVVVI
jgi:hypothetical protein